MSLEGEYTTSSSTTTENATLLGKRKIDHDDDGDNTNWEVWTKFDQSANDFNEDDKSFSSTATIFPIANFLAYGYPQKTKDSELIPGFEGDLYVRGNCKDEDFRKFRYQYSMSSYADKSFNPSIIACAKNEADVMRGVEYATKQNVAVSIRTGTRNLHSYN